MGIDGGSIKSLVEDVPDKPTLVILEGRYQNWIKPIILLDALKVDWDYVVLGSLAEMKTDWYLKIHPLGMAPALIDGCDGQRVVLWDSSTIMQYLCGRYDSENRWFGRNWAEKVEIMNWVQFFDTSLGPASKNWVHIEIMSDELKTPLQAAQIRFLDAVRGQYAVLNKRLEDPGQQWLALKDRPTIADLAIYPFTDPETTAKMKLDMQQWPALQQWSGRMRNLDSVVRTYDQKDSRKATTRK